MVSGISVWFSIGWNCPGVYTAPIAVKNVPKASNTPITMNLCCGNLRISGVTSFVHSMRGYSTAPPYTR